MSDTAQNHLATKMKMMFDPASSVAASSPPSAKLPVSTDDFASQLLQTLPTSDEETPTPSPAAPVNMQSVASAVPLAVAQATDTLNPPQAITPTVKEVVEPTFMIEKPNVDQVPGVQYVEAEPHELPPEVESFIAKVEEHQEQIPAEVVMTNQNAMPQPSNYLAKPVIVLPITPQMEKSGRRKAAKFSIRWLVEFSHKMMKMFRGGTVYRESV